MKACARRIASLFHPSVEALLFRSNAEQIAFLRREGRDSTAVTSVSSSTERVCSHMTPAAISFRLLAMAEEAPEENFTWWADKNAVISASEVGKVAED